MNENNNTTSEIAAFLRDIFKYWYLFAIFLFFSLATAFTYLKFVAKNYNVGTAVLFNLDTNSNNAGRSSDELLEVYSIIEKEKNIQNELYRVTSSPIIREVIEEMDIRTSYFLQEDKIPKELKFSLKEIYTSSPFIVIPNENHVQPIDALFYINLLSEEKFIISVESPKTTLIDFSTEYYVGQDVNVLFSGVYNFGEAIEFDFCSFKVLLNSNYNPDLYLGKDLFFSFNSLYSLTGKFQAALNAQTISLESTMVQLTIKTDNINKGIDFLNTLTNKYINITINEKNFLANQTIDYIDRQLSSLSDSLGISESQLQSIRRSANIMNIDEKAENLYSQIQVLDNSRVEIERRISYLQEIEDYFTINKDSSKILTPSSLGINDPLLNNLISELTELNNERQSIISKKQLKNPRLQTLSLSISNIENAIEENIRFNISSSKSELNTLNEKISNLNAEFRRLPGTQRRLLGIERKFNLNEDAYNSLLEKRLQAQIIKSSNKSNIEIIEPPSYMSVASPRRMIIIFLALFIGVGIPLLFIFGKRLLTDRIYTIDEIKKYSNIPHVGALPRKISNFTNVVLHNPRSYMAEAFHTIKGDLIYYLYGKKKNVILITSLIPGEGKSFTSINLATSFAENSSTVLLEMDLRRPSNLYEEFGANVLVGVSSYLINKATLDEIIIPTNIANMDIIRAGSVPPNPVALLSSDKTDELFRELSKKYDNIIIDTPPYGLVSDPFLLMKYADLKIIISRLGIINKKTFRHHIESIESKKIENLFLLVNDLNKFKESYVKYGYTDYLEKKSSKISDLGKIFKKKKS